MTVRTRFAPSPTGYLHIGGARTALFSWAYARKHGGKFVLRIEDTDRERSTEASVQAILDAMQWLNLDCDEGPFYQMQRLSRYREVADTLIANGHAYPCYCSKTELEAMREDQRTRGLKPRYDGRCRNGRTPPPGVAPIIRFKNPMEGAVAWNDLVKGMISVENAELDDLVILRADGIPTYNFGVVVDDIDMNITHVIRGDDHVNNTPRQINIYRALGAALPSFGHVPMILGHDGERLSKRHGAVSVMQYLDEGFLPEALFNYLARLGWGHGDDEVFSREQFVQWFELTGISHSPARFNPEKLLWINQQYIKSMPDATLEKLVRSILEKRDVKIETGPALNRVLPLFKERAVTLVKLADEAMLFYAAGEPAPELRAAHITAECKPALNMLAERLQNLSEWTTGAISDAVKFTLTQSNLAMPRLAVPVRVCVFGRTKTPDLAAVLFVMGRERVIESLRRYAA